MKNNKTLSILIVVLMVLAIGLGTALAITYGSRYDEGLKYGQEKQLKSLKGDRHKGVVPDLVGQNANQIGSWTWSGKMRVDIGKYVTLPVAYKAPGGEEITENTAKNYKIVSQEPAADTVFDIVYQKDSSGKEWDNLIESTGVQSIIVTVEKIK